MAEKGDEENGLLRKEVEIQDLEDPLFLMRNKHRPSCSSCFCDACEIPINTSSTINDIVISATGNKSLNLSVITTNTTKGVDDGQGQALLIGNTNKTAATQASRYSNKSKVSKCTQYLPEHWRLKLAQVLCVVYVLVLTFSFAPVGLRDPASGNVVDVNSETNTENGVILINGAYRPVVAIGRWQLFCLAMSRMSAFSLYPPMVLVFLTKCRACIDRLNKTPLSMYMTKDFHELHSYCGRYIAFDVWFHTFFHLLRWGLQNNLSLVWSTRTGLTGLIVVIATPIICLPMMYWKKALRYEIRKGLHFLFYLFAVGMCFHVPPSAIPNGGFCAYVLGFCISLYTVDAMYVQFFMTEIIETSRFHVLPSGVQMTMDVSDRFQQYGENGGYVYVCLPWVDKNQWHAFSLFEHPTEPQRRQVFMLKTGDWTEEVHYHLERSTVRPVWVQGPFSSPYNKACFYDNQILVASGIGITPALSVIRNHKDSRRINLIWAVRDPAMLEFFMEHLYLDHEGWNLIFYTGKAPLNPVLEELNTNIKVIKSRPDLTAVIPNIIHGIESKSVLPEDSIPCAKCQVIRVLVGRMAELDEKRDLTEDEKLKELTNFARTLGFQFTDLFNHLEGNDGDAEMEVYRDAFETLAPIQESNAEEPAPAVTKIDKQSLLETIRKFGVKHSPITLENFLRNKDEVNTRRASIAGASACRPWEKNKSASKYVKSLSKSRVLATWGILYCGGSPVVEETLEEISKEYSIALNSESFAW